MTMAFKLLRQSYMLLETVAMLYRFVNGIDFKEMLNRQKFLAGSDVPANMYDRMGRLQQILEQACAGLDPKDPELQRFFGKADLEYEDVYIAELLTFSFCTIAQPDLHKHAEAICAIWKKEWQKEGCWLRPDTGSTLVLSHTPGGKGDLFDQVCAMNYPPDFQLKLYGALRDFDRTMDELVGLIEAPAKRLEQLYRQERSLFDEVECYWQDELSRTDPLKLAKEILGHTAIPGIPGKIFVLPLYMQSNYVAFGINEDETEPYNLLMVGSGATVSSRPRRENNELESIGTILKAIGDKRRLEILRRLSKGRSYCHELSDAMNLDSGNMSRHLTLLHKYGFLRQERAPMVNYYETNKEALHDFLQLVETLVCS